MVLTDFVDNIETAIDKTLHTISVFSDFEIAFDTIDNSLLEKNRNIMA